MEKYFEKYRMEQAVFTTADGKTLNYCRRLINPELPGNAAVLLFFHGAGERGCDNSRQLTHGAGEVVNYCEKNSQKVLLLFPQCPENQQWVNTPWGELRHSLPPESEAMGLVRQMLKKELADTSIDLNRIYVSGISMGGYATWDILSREPELFAGAFPVCGGADTAMAERLKNIPILTYHGDSDTTVPVSRTRDIVAALKSAGSTSINYVELPGCGHNSWEPAFAVEANWQWLFNCHK